MGIQFDNHTQFHKAKKSKKKSKKKKSTIHQQIKDPWVVIRTNNGR